MDAGDDWRASLQPEARSRIMNKIMETLRKHVPEAEGLIELQRIAVRYEDKVYAAATNQSDYLRTISLKMLSMESRANTQQNPAPARTDPSDSPTQARSSEFHPRRHEAMDASNDWRAYLPPEARSRIVNKIMETLRKHVPVLVPEKAEGLVELQRIAVRFEDNVYAAATNQSDYLRKISLKILSMETPAKTQQNPAPGSSSKGKKQKKLRCHFCKKGGHFKKDCLKRKIWFDKKGVAYNPTHKRTKAHENKNEGTVLKGPTLSCICLYARAYY